MPASEAKTSEPKKLPGIFISYRRSDNPDAVGRIYDRLVSEFGKSRVFKDVDSIPLGQDFRGHLNDIVGNCAAVLAIIGPKWTDTRNSAGQRRLEDPDDFVRIELEAALARDIPVVPVLVGHAAMPGTAELPSSLASIAFRQSIEVRPDPDFHNDATRLVTALRAIIDPNAPVPAPLALSDVRSPGSRWPWPAAFAIATLAAIAFAFPALKHWRETSPPEIRTEISTPAEIDSNGGIALSPDGKQIAFVAMTGGVSRLWLRPLAATTARVLPGTDGAMLPFWSPDGQSIGFFSIDALKRLDVGSGTVTKLTPVTIAGNGAAGGTWNSDDVILFAQGLGKPLARVAATGGAVKEITALDKLTLAHLYPVFLPDGRHFVFAAVGGLSPGTYFGSLDGGTPVRLTPALGELAWFPSGWLLIGQFDTGVLLAQRFDPDKGELLGAPITLADGGGAVSASTSGLMALRERAFQQGQRQLKWRSRTGQDLSNIGSPDETWFSPRVSADGRRVVVQRGDSSKSDIWLLDGERATRVTFDAAGNGFPFLSPDGARILFSSARPDAPGLYQKNADGAGDEELLVHSEAIAPSSWSPDGRHLLYVNIGQGTLLDLWVLPMTGDRKPWVFANSAFSEGGGEFSPDGKWVAYESDESKRREIYVRPFIEPGAVGGNAAARGGKWQVSTSGGTYPKWGPGGKELYFINPEGDLMAAPITVSGTALSAGTPVKLFAMQVLGGGRDTQQGPQYDVTRNGRFLINTVPNTGVNRIPPIVLIQNWNPDAGK